jgi:TetR/AcrR family transcriptional regulator
MARPRAADHDDKRRAILDRSAVLFAANGYDRTSLSAIAEACGMSKALLYHYYADKSALLFDIVRGHLQHLLDVTAFESVGSPRDHLIRLSTALLDSYGHADGKHHVQLNQMRLLSPDRQATLKEMERTLVRRFAAAISPCVPHPARESLAPLTMSLFGMLNWNHLWFREDGAMSRAEYARMAVVLLLDGAGGMAASERPPRRAGATG